MIQTVRHSELQRDRPQHNDQEASKGTVHQKSTTQSSRLTSARADGDFSAASR